MELHVHAHVELIAHVRTGKNSSEWSQFVERLNGSHARLIGPLEVAEEEGPILRTGPPKWEPNWCRSKNGSRFLGSRLRAGIGGEVMIPMEVEPAAVIRVAARPRHDIDGAVARQADAGSKFTVEI